MKIVITNRHSGAAQFTTNASSIGQAVRIALAAKANLRGADLHGADLHGADLHGANLRSANLHGADLHGANLRSANLHGANLRSADLHGADLHGADLRGADLYGANLRGADLHGADLCGADLHGADLRGADLYGANLRSANLHGADLHGADLHGADLRGADLYGANLRGAKNAGLVIARTRMLPAGDLVVWKKCRGGVLVKLLIPAKAKRSHAFGRKCRAEYAKVLEVVGAKVGESSHECGFFYKKGKTVKPKLPFSLDWQNECASGIHFFITKEEAEDYV